VRGEDCLAALILETFFFCTQFRMMSGLAFGCHGWVSRSLRMPKVDRVVDGFSTEDLRG
jgi:hypothetical protein